MSDCCDQKDCCSSTDCCDTGSCSPGADQCPMQSCDCPVEGLTKMWTGSFRQAVQEAQVEVLKAKILKAWGPMLDQTSDAVLEAMGAMWAAKSAEVRQAEAKEALKGRIRELFNQERKK